MNIKTVALTREQYQAIIQTMKQGFTGCRPNERVATALVLEVISQILCKRRFRCNIEQNIFKAGAAQAAAALSTK